MDRLQSLPRALLWGAGGAALGIAAAAVLLHVVGLDAARSVVASVDPRLVPLVLAVQVASTAALTQVYRTTYASQGGRLGFRDALTVCLGAFSLTQLLPGGGAAGGVFAVQRLRWHGADPMRAVTTVLLLGLVTMGTLGIGLSAATTVTALGSHRYATHAVASAAVTLAILAALVGLRHLANNARLRTALAHRLGRLRWRGRAVGAEWTTSLQRHQAFLQHPSSLLRPAGWSAVNWSLDVAVLALVLLAVDARAPFIGVLVAFAVANLLNSLPLMPGGIGLVEAGLAGTLIGFGADPVATSVGVLAYRAIAYWFPVLLAAPVLASGLRRGARVVEVAA